MVFCSLSGWCHFELIPQQDVTLVCVAWPRLLSASRRRPHLQCPHISGSWRPGEIQREVGPHQREFLFKHSPESCVWHRFLSVFHPVVFQRPSAGAAHPDAAAESPAKPPDLQQHPQISETLRSDGPLSSFADPEWNEGRGNRWTHTQLNTQLVWTRGCCEENEKKCVCVLLCWLQLPAWPPSATSLVSSTNQVLAPLCFFVVSIASTCRCRCFSCFLCFFQPLLVPSTPTFCTTWCQSWREPALPARTLMMVVCLSV